MKRVKKVIKCEKTIQLVRKALSAGYIDPETGKIRRGNIDTPLPPASLRGEGSVLSPLLSNIVLHELDKYMNDLKSEFDSGLRRRPNPEYVKLNSKRRYIRELTARKEILRKMRELAASDPMDPNFKRLKYVRYADDFVVLVIGSQEDATKLRSNIKKFLHKECKLDLNVEKTLITNIQKEGFKFLGADCNRADMTKNHVIRRSNLSIRATTRLRVNIDLGKLYKTLVKIGVAKFDQTNKMTPRGTAKNAMINFSHADIIAFYNSKIRGLLNFYSFAGNRKRLNLVI